MPAPAFEANSDNPPVEELTDPARACYQQEQVAFWDSFAAGVPECGGQEAVSRRRILEVYRNLVPPGRTVLEIGCGRGDLLAALGPSLGVGVDLSGRMIEHAARSFPALRFLHQDAAALATGEKFDFVILSNVIHEIWDPLEVLQVAKRHSHPRSRLIVGNISPLWGPVLHAAQRFHSPAPPRPTWLGERDLTHFLHLAGFETIRTRRELLMPLAIPLLTPLANRFLSRIWPFGLLALTQVLVARPRLPRRCDPDRSPPRVSVVIPALNEEGTIPSAFSRTPEMGAGTELIFVEGGSRDNTYGAIERGLAEYPGRDCKLLRSDGKEKGDAVRLGFAHATGDVLMILDSDLAVAPEDLPKFLDALTSGGAEFANGSRLVLPMEGGAMRPLNLLANRFFGWAFSWVLGQPVTDTLCGTKVLWRADYEEIAANRAYFGDFDPFADFDLLLGAARLNLSIVDVPVRYRSRVYGTTNIDRWRHGRLLVRMLVFASRKLLFI